MTETLGPDTCEDCWCKHSEAMDMSNVEELIEVRSSAVHGTGAFARCVIGAYEGRRYPPGTELETGVDDELTYLFGLSDGTTIDGMEGGNATRHLNHSCAPNCEAIEEVQGEELVLRIVTRRAIAAGAELFIDYGLIVDESDDGAYAYLCRARTCRGTMAAAA
jgi:SET domain-containing protein